MPKRNRQTDNLVAMIRASVPRGRSPLFRWMLLQYDTLSETFDKTKPDWTALGAFAASLGVLNADQKPASGEATRQTWYRVRLDVAARAARKRAAEQAQTSANIRKARPVPVLAPDEIAPGVRLIAPKPERPRMQLDIRPALAVADLSSAEPQPAQASAESTNPVLSAGVAQNRDAESRSIEGPPAWKPETLTVAEQIQRALQITEHQTVPMPKVIR